MDQLPRQNLRVVPGAQRAILALCCALSPPVVPSNAQPLAPTVVINEIHYDEPDKNARTEFIELYNPGDTNVDLSGWVLKGGIEYTFPSDTVLPAGSYLVAAQDPAVISNRFSVAALGPWTGKLNNAGEEIDLRDADGMRIDRVGYNMGFPWPTVGDPPAFSIELYNPLLDNDLGGSWHLSDGGFEPPPPAVFIPTDSTWKYFKGTTEPSATPDAWRQIGFDDSTWESGTGPIGYRDGYVGTPLYDMLGNYTTVYFRNTILLDNPKRIQALRLSVLYGGGYNLWLNGVLLTNSPNATGNEPHDAVVPEIPDLVDYEEFEFTDLEWLLEEGTNVIAAQIINNSLLFSSRCFFDARLVEVPKPPPIDRGPTPGAQNSVYTTNAPPQMRQVSHTPKQPASGEDVLVTVKVTDPDGIAGVLLSLQSVEPGDYFCRWLKDGVLDPRFEDPSEWRLLPMTDDGTGADGIAGDAIYSAIIPGAWQRHRRLVRYRIIAMDALGASRRAPYLDDPQPNFAYFTYDGVPAWTGRVRPGEEALTFDGELMSSIANYHLISTAKWVEESQYGSYTGSAYRWPGTLVYDGEVYDHIRYRPRGGVHRFYYGKNFWKFDFNRGHWFQARDDFSRPYKTKWDKLNFGSIMQRLGFGYRGEQGLFEGVGFRLFNLAGVEACKTHYVQFRVIDQADEFGPNQYEGDYYGLFLAIEQMDGRFLKEHDLPDGNLYKIERHIGEPNNQGFGQVTDGSDVAAFIDTYRNTEPSADWWRENLDLRRYYSYRSILEAIHHYDISGGRNYFYFHNPVTDTFQIHPWDIDVTWADIMSGTGDHDFKFKVAENPVFRQDYLNRLREILDLLYNPEQTGMLIDETVQTVYRPGAATLVEADRRLWDNNPRTIGRDFYYDISPTGDFAGMIQIVKDYVVTRGQWIRTNLLTDESLIPETPTLTYEGPNGFPFNRLTFKTSAFESPVRESFAAIQWRIAEISPLGSRSFDPSLPRKYEIAAAWDSGQLDRFRGRYTIPPSAVRPGLTCRARVRHKDAAGRWSHWSDPLQFTTGDAVIGAITNDLAISEIMYKPPPPTPEEAALGFKEADFEFIELKHVGSGAVYLSDVKFTEGVEFDFATSELSILTPGQFALLVRRRAAFEARYGTGLPIAGEYYDSDQNNLSNGGEQLTLSLVTDQPVRDLTYDDVTPWPSSPDQMGTSLVLVDPAARPDHAHPANWRGSVLAGGSPGRDDTMNLDLWKAYHFTEDEINLSNISGSDSDADGDGRSNLVEYIEGTDPRDEFSFRKVEPIFCELDGVLHAAVRISRPVGALDVQSVFRASGDLKSWSTDSILIAEPPFQNGDGTETLIVIDQVPISGQSQRFLSVEAHWIE